MNEFLNEYGWLIMAIFGIVYELVVRFKPSERNLSLLDLLHTVLNVLIPNKKIGWSGSHKRVFSSKDKRKHKES